MVLKRELDSLDGLNAEIAKEYRKTASGKYVPDVDGVEVENVPTLIETNRKIREERDGFERKLKGFGDLDPEKAREAIEQVKRTGDLTPETLAKKIQEAVDRETANLKEKLETTNKTSENLKAENRKLTTRQDISEAIRKHGADDILTRPIILQEMDVIEKNGKESVVLRDEAGQIRVNGKGDPMTYDERIAQMKDDEKYAALFPGPGNTGPGTKGGGGGNPPSGNIDTSKMSGAQLMELGFKKGSGGKS